LYQGKAGKNLNRFGIKLIANAIVVIPLLMWFTEAGLGEALITALVLAVLAYLIGDLLILRMSNNTAATISDAVLAFVYLWLAADWMDWRLNLWEILIISAVLGIVEAIFHRYLDIRDKDTVKNEA
jgi:thiamine transporter ThiT